MAIVSFDRYRDLLRERSPRTIEAIVEVYRDSIEGRYKYCPWWHPGLQRGTAVLDDQEALDHYISAYGLMHIRKLSLAIRDNILLSTVSEGLSIVDWGCGQGLGSAVAMAYLKEVGKAHLIQKVHLIEPSKLALERAECHIQLLAEGQALNFKVEAHNMYLPSVPEIVPAIESMDIEESIVLHIFSNILDVPALDLYALAKLISDSKQQHIFVCVAPLYQAATKRTLAFSSYFSNKNNFREAKLPDVNYGGRKSATAHIVNFDTGIPVLADRDMLPCTLVASYQSDLLRGKDYTTKDSIFTVSAPFDIGLVSYSSAHPILAVLANMVTRGLPTRLSPYLEGRLAEHHGVKLSSISSHEISYVSDADLDQEDIINYSSICRGVAWVQRALLELLLGGRLAVEPNKVWNIHVVERDVPVVIWALEDLRLHWSHLSQMSRDYKDYQMPACSLTIVSKQQIDTIDKQISLRYVDTIDRRKYYSLFIDVSCENPELQLEPVRVQNDAYIIIRPKESQCEEQKPDYYRSVITTDKIYYDPLCDRQLDGSYKNLPTVDHVRYFLQLLFRKMDFRPGQIPIISRALQHKSVVGLLPTGGGKSITYQIAALLQPGVTLVVDPLIALMQDQYSGLLRSGIDICAYINSTQTDDEKRAVLANMYGSHYQIVFLSPERLAIPKFRMQMQEMHNAGVYFVYGVVDEVHCVSEWGHDFRFDYLHLGRNLYRYALPKGEGDHVCLFGLTATASFDVLADVERELSGDDAFPLGDEAIVRYENTNRLELQYRVVRVDGAGISRNEFDVFDQKHIALGGTIPKLQSWYNELQEEGAQEYIRKRFVERESIINIEILRALEEQDLGQTLTPTWVENKEGAMVFFTPHRKGKVGVSSSQNSTGHVSEGIQPLVSRLLPNVSVSGFVGGDDLKVVEDFVAGSSDVMVATKAFGMGIDKPNIRFTVNVCMSGSLEGFVQEAGRAGRDRRMALSLILYSPEILPNGITADNKVHKFFFDNNFRGEDFEKRVMFELMFKHQMGMVDYRSGDSIQGVFSGFLEQLERANPGDKMIFELSYRRSSSVKPMLDTTANESQREFYRKYYEGPEESYIASLKKAIYRMCCVGLISDYMQGYGRGVFVLVMERKSDGGYYKGLERFLLRYYTQERVGIEIDRAKQFKGTSELMKCLGYLTDFIYTKIASKRERAISDMEYFCKLAIDLEAQGRDWKVVNEDLKDYLYYYFNSKYARSGYMTDSGEPFSLGDDSNWGKVSSPELLKKYLRVIDNDVVGTSSPRDNIKHLQGAVRLLRRGVTDENPMLDWLIVYCHLFEDSYKVKSLREEMKKIYIQGYYAWRRHFQKIEDFYFFVEEYHREVNVSRRLVANAEEIKLLREWRLEAEVILQSQWIEHFNKRYVYGK